VLLAAGQSAAALHPQVSVPGSHCAPFAVVHTAQLPEPPHAAGIVPATQALPEQQNPPLHEPLPVAPQADVQMPAVHVGVPAAHGAAQAWPFSPHARFPVPDTQIPASQQPPLHCVSLVPRQAFVQRWVLVLQAWPPAVAVAAAQSLCELHPHMSVVGSH
jgi:hypothetical protein